MNELVKKSTEDIKDKLYSYIELTFDKIESVKHDLSYIYEGVANDLDILKANEEQIPYSEAYNKGLEDAWELLKKICIMSPNDKIKILGLNYTGVTIIGNFTPQEVLAKLEAYEKELEEIKVGDEITVVGNAIKGYVIDESKECEDCYVVLITNYKDLHTAIYNKNVIEKTGKHIDISSVLEQIDGDE